MDNVKELFINGEADLLFKKVIIGPGRFDYKVECYHNGVLIQTFNNNKVAERTLANPKTLYLADTIIYQVKLKIDTQLHSQMYRLSKAQAMQYHNRLEVSRVHDR